MATCPQINFPATAELHGTLETRTFSRRLEERLKKQPFRRDRSRLFLMAFNNDEPVVDITSLWPLFVRCRVIKRKKGSHDRHVARSPPVSLIKMAAIVSDGDAPYRKEFLCSLFFRQVHLPEAVSNVSLVQLFGQVWRSLSIRCVIFGAGAVPEMSSLLRSCCFTFDFKADMISYKVVFFGRRRRPRSGARICRTVF